jgi:predicted dehydrogenase
MNNTSRRDFLKSSTAATAAITASAVAAPLIVHSSVLGDKTAAPANSRIRMGFIGMGKQMGGHFSWCMNSKEVEVVAICDVDTTRREHAGKRYADHMKRLGRKDAPKLDMYVDYNKIIERQDIDAVLIATPDHWHAIMIIEAVQSGKDVYCEKPLTLTIHEAEQCVKVVRKHKAVFQTGSQQRNEFRGWFKKAAAYVRAGRIGQVRTITVGVNGPSKWCDLKEEKMEPGLDWERWIGPAPMRPYNSILSPRGVHNHYPRWRSYREYSGGMMTDIGAHHYDIAQWGLGMDGSGPVEIIPPRDKNAERGVTYVYENGVRMVHGGPSGITFVGDKGIIEVDRNRIRSLPGDIFEKPLGDNDKEEFASYNHKQNWVDCIHSRKSPAADVHIGASTVTVCHLGNHAYWNDRKLHWDPKNWTFVTADGKPDLEANKWLDRERRGKYQLPKV